MNEDSFEQTGKAFFEIKEVSSVSRDTESDFEKVLEIASKVLQQIKVREEIPSQNVKQ